MRQIATVRGRAGAAATAHPAATEAAITLLRRGGSAADAAIAAQAVVCVALPEAAGLGGDMLAVRAPPSAELHAVTGTGTSPAAFDARIWARPDAPAGASVTVPGLVSGWLELHRQAGRAPLLEVLQPALDLATSGIVVTDELIAAVDAQRARLERVSPGCPLLALRPGDRWFQPQLADLLSRIAEDGARAFYAGHAAAALAAACRAAGGWLTVEDLAAHRSRTDAPTVVRWGAGHVAGQPAPSQGPLLSMALQWMDDAGFGLSPERREHTMVELTEAVFAHRNDVASGAALLDRPLHVDTDRAQRRGGPRPYLHTAGVSVAAADGDVVSSLISVFDDFGSGVWVPELGIMLNNRADSFTVGANRPRPAARPVHTLAPVVALDERGGRLALATPGADGQIQTLLQVLCAQRFAAARLADAIARPRWRSQSAGLCIESDHPEIRTLTARGHRLLHTPPGDSLFGAVVAAGTEGTEAYAVADWRRRTTAGSC